MSVFEWDPKKAQTNLAKHGVSFQEAATVWADPLAIVIPDPLHSGTEDRYVIIGYSTRHRALIVVHVERGSAIRIISARKATPTERKTYEET